MSRAGRARRIAAAAAFGGGGIAGVGVAAYGGLVTEVRMTRRAIGQPFGQVGPGGEGRYEPGSADGSPASGPAMGGGAPVRLGFLGDSTSVGLGAEHAWQTPGAVVARGLARISGRPVDLRVTGEVGAQSSALEAQTVRMLAVDVPPDVVVIMVGANDVTHRSPRAVAVRGLYTAVRRLRDAGVEVVVGTCPDLGTITQIPVPLRYLARRLSRDLAAAQTVAVVEAGGRTVSLGDLLGPEFAARPLEMFASDRYHPSAAGYARAAAAVLPSVAAALGYLRSTDEVQIDEVRADEGVRIDDAAHAAARAADVAGTEVVATEVSGRTRGPGGRWASSRRRRTAPGGGAVS